MGQPSDFEAALESLPLFPLPGVILMPGVLLPLHVFEPRYRKMVRDVLDSHRSLAIVQILDDEVEEGHPPRIAEVGGAGTIVDCTELPNGRFNVVLRGRARVRLEELPFSPPYRRARCAVLPSTDAELPSSTISALLGAVTSFVGLVQRRDASFEFRLPRDAGSELLVNASAQHLLIDGRDKQRVLEISSLQERADALTEILALQHLSLGTTGGAVN
jgi:ATP-dependent Lon protease